MNLIICQNRLTACWDSLDTDRLQTFRHGPKIRLSGQTNAQAAEEIMDWYTVHNFFDCGYVEDIYEMEGSFLPCFVTIIHWAMPASLRFMIL